MHDSVAFEIETRGAAFIEHRDQGRVANAEQSFFKCHRVADVQRARLLFGDRHLEDMMRSWREPHSKSMPPGVITADARRAEWHWMFTATGFMVMWVAAIST